MCGDTGMNKPTAELECDSQAPEVIENAALIVEIVSNHVLCSVISRLISCVYEVSDLIKRILSG